jgi:exodeoxyribonuclease VII large subunit
VQQLNEGVDAAIRDTVGPVWVAGEISRFTAHRSGHWYFDLADEKSKLSCAMFRGRNRRVRFQPEEGMQVLALGTPGVYLQQGRYQLIVEELEPQGRGAAALARERLKMRLEAEGLFAPERKKQIPAVSRRIGVATSPTGAAVRDVVRVLRRRFASVSVLLAPTAVQGERAPQQIVSALAALDRRDLDVILLVRGGGAREDLVAFDDERVVRAVAATRLPIVTGIGHEIDTSLADLAADLRAPTPSAAAEVVVREQRELRDRLARSEGALGRAMRYRLSALAGKLREAEGSRALGSVPLKLERARMRLADLDLRLERAERDLLAGRRTRLAGLQLERAQRDRLTASRTRLNQARHRLSPESLKAGLADKSRRLAAAESRLAAAARDRTVRARRLLGRLGASLDAMSPLKVLQRGYALAQRDGAEGTVIRNAADLRVGDTLYVRFAAGAARAEVIDPNAGGEEESRR